MLRVLYSNMPTLVRVEVYLERCCVQNSSMVCAAVEGGVFKPLAAMALNRCGQLWVLLVLG